MKVLAIDPGCSQSGYCIIDMDSLKPVRFGKVENSELRECLIAGGFGTYDFSAIEMVASYGMPVGAEVFDTVRWIGRFEEILGYRSRHPPVLIKRIEEKMHICHTTRASDSTIRRALIDRFACHDKRSGKGTIANPDWFYGFKADIWAAYAVGITYIESRIKKEDLQNHD